MSTPGSGPPRRRAAMAPAGRFHGPCGAVEARLGNCGGIPRQSKMKPGIVLMLALLATAHLFAQTPSSTPPVQKLGGAQWEDWTGVTPGPEGATLKAPADQAAFRYPDGPRGFYKNG